GRPARSPSAFAVLAVADTGAFNGLVIAAHLYERLGRTDDAERCTSRARSATTTTSRSAHFRGGPFSLTVWRGPLVTSSSLTGRSCRNFTWRTIQSRDGSSVDETLDFWRRMVQTVSPSCRSPFTPSSAAR